MRETLGLADAAQILWGLYCLDVRDNVMQEAAAKLLVAGRIADVAQSQRSSVASDALQIAYVLARQGWAGDSLPDVSTAVGAILESTWQLLPPLQRAVAFQADAALGVWRAAAAASQHLPRQG